MYNTLKVQHTAVHAELQATRKLLMASEERATGLCISQRVESIPKATRPDRDIADGQYRHFGEMPESSYHKLLDQWWLRLSLVMMTVGVICLLQQRSGVNHAQVVQDLHLEPEQMQVYREKMVAATRLTAIPFCLLAATYHLLRGDSYSAAQHGIMLLYLGFYCQMNPPTHKQLVRVSILCCFVFWPLEAFLIHVCKSHEPAGLPGVWPALIGLPAANALLHDSVGIHVSCMLAHNAMIFAFQADIVRTASLVVTTITTFLFIAKISYFRDLAQFEPLAEAFTRLHTIICVSLGFGFGAALLMIALKERYPEAFQNAIHKDSPLWSLVALALLLLGLLGLLHPHVMSDHISRLGICTDLEAATLDQRYPEQMASTVRLAMLAIPPLFLVCHLMANESFPMLAMYQCLCCSLMALWISRSRPSHRELVSWFTWASTAFFPAHALLLGVGMPEVFHECSGVICFSGTTYTSAAIMMPLTGVILHTSLACHLGPVFCSCAVTFAVNQTIFTRLITVAAAISSCVLLLLKINFIRGAINTQENALLRAQYRAFSKLRDTMVSDNHILATV